MKTLLQTYPHLKNYTDNSTHSNFIVNNYILTIWKYAIINEILGVYLVKVWIDKLKERTKQLNDKIENLASSRKMSKIRITGSVIWNLTLIF